MTTTPFRATLFFDIVNGNTIGERITVPISFTGAVNAWGTTITGETTYTLPIRNNPNEYYVLSDVMITGFSATGTTCRSIEIYIDEYFKGDLIVIESNLPSVVDRQFRNTITAFTPGRVLKFRAIA